MPRKTYKKYQKISKKKKRKKRKENLHDQLMTNILTISINKQ